jgi:hypothetical protein
MDVGLGLACPAIAPIEQDQRNVLGDRRAPRCSGSQLGPGNPKLQPPRKPPESILI